MWQVFNCFPRIFLKSARRGGPDWHVWQDSPPPRGMGEKDKMLPILLCMYVDRAAVASVLVWRQTKKAVYDCDWR